MLSDNKKTPPPPDVQCEDMMKSFCDGSSDEKNDAVLICVDVKRLNIAVQCEHNALVLSYVLANTPMESNGQGWGAWSSLVEMC